MDNAKFVERVRDLCKEQKTSITKLEAQLDFSNGYIGKWAKRPSSPPYEKLTSIAQALGVTVEELTGEEPEQKEKPNTLDGIELEKLSPARRALLEALEGMDDENIMKIVRIAQAVKKELPE